MCLALGWRTNLACKTERCITFFSCHHASTLQPCNRSMQRAAAPGRQAIAARGRCRLPLPAPDMGRLAAAHLCTPCPGSGFLPHRLWQEAHFACARPASGIHIPANRCACCPKMLHGVKPGGLAPLCCKAIAHLPHGATSPLCDFSFHDLTTPPTPRSALPLRRIRRHLHPGRAGRAGARPRGGFVGIDRS